MLDDDFENFLKIEVTKSIIIKSEHFDGSLQRPIVRKRPCIRF